MKESIRKISQQKDQSAFQGLPRDRTFATRLSRASMDKKHQGKIFLLIFFSITSGLSTANAGMRGLKFSTTGCSKPVRYTPNALKVTTNWSGSAYEVKVKNQILCSAKIKNPSYKLDDHTINLSYDADISEGASKCYCESSSIFLLTKLPDENEYTINFHVNYIY